MAKFTSKSHVAINVVMPSGVNVHVSFTEQTGGGSVLYTNNNDLIEAIRRHHKYGKLFKEVEMPAAQQPAAKVAAPAGTQAPQQANTQQQAPAAPAVKEMEFSNNEDAKDYLAERFGLSRSKMRTRAAIEELAKSVNIKVKWIS